MLLPCDPETLSFSRITTTFGLGINGQHLEHYETIEIFRSVIQDGSDDATTRTRGHADGEVL